MQLGLSAAGAELAALGLAGLYLLWYRWLILRAGLALDGARAALVLLVSSLVTGLFTAMPMALGFGPSLAQLGHL
jgi:hypothetical protein